MGEACTQLVLRLLYVSCVCVRLHISCVSSYRRVTICHYSYEHSGSYWNVICRLNRSRYVKLA